MKFFIMQFSPTSCHLISLGSKCDCFYRRREREREGEREIERGRRNRLVIAKPAAVQGAHLFTVFPLNVYHIN
jgi:hypothetical protein